MCSFEWIGLHFKAVFRRLSGIERPENSPADCFQRDGAGRPVDASQGKPTQKCSSRRRKCILGNLETHSNRHASGRWDKVCVGTPDDHPVAMIKRRSSKQECASLPYRFILLLGCRSPITLVFDLTLPSSEDSRAFRSRNGGYRKSSRMGVKMSSRVPASRQRVPWGMFEGKARVSPGPTSTGSPSTVKRKRPDLT